MMTKKRKLILAVFLLLVIAVCGVTVFFNQQKSTAKNTDADSNSFVGDTSCKSCHQSEYDHWKKSDHFMAMQVATDSTVLGDFNRAVFTADGVTSRFFKKDGKFFINTEDEKGTYRDYEVKYTFGVYPLQQYLVDFPGGRKQVTRQSWDAKQKRWFHQYKGDKIPPGDWLHWTGNAQNWNTTCADCHSTHLQKNYDVEKDEYHTAYNAINVSCESCHGAGKKHIDYIKIDFQQGNKVEGSYLTLTKNTSQQALINTCAPCHSRRSVLSTQLIASNELLDNYLPDLPITPNFYADGQMKDEVFVYTSFMQSKMAQAGLACNNCHDSHTGKARLIGNALCMSCHEPKYNAFEHTRHKANIAASNCVSCHMPTTTYMGNDARHDHSFRVPRPDLSARFATPNACNNCHKDKTSQWAADQVAKWYGSKRKYHFSEDLIPGSQTNNPNAESHLLRLLENKTAPQIVKAAAVYYLQNSLTSKSLSALIGCLTSKEAYIRYTALRSLANFPAQGWQNAAAPLLKDPVRAVRVAAADLFLLTPADQLDSSLQSALEKAKVELYDYLYNQADFPTGNVLLGDYYSRLKNYPLAEKYYLRGLKKDKLMNLARLNLSVIYNLQGQNEKAIRILNEAALIDPKNDQVYYQLALLQNELQNRAAALTNFDKALKLKSNNPRVYYNYGLLLAQDNLPKAIQVLSLAISRWPDDKAVRYALTYVLLQSGKNQQALVYAKLLKQSDPNNPEYQSIFQTLGL